MAEPQYNPNGIGYFHPSLNMSPFKAAKLLMKAGAAHAKGTVNKKGKMSRGDRFMVRGPVKGGGGAAKGGGVARGGGKK